MLDVALVKLIPEGSKSLTFTPVALAGPLLFNAMVNVTVSPNDKAVFDTV